MSVFDFSGFAIVAVIALVVEALFGYPSALFARVGHPVTWIGGFISWIEVRWNNCAFSANKRRLFGIGLIMFLVLIGLSSGFLILFFAHQFTLATGLFVCGVLASSLLAQRSLYDHVGAVVHGLDSGGLDKGREAVSHIVGRDASTLDEAATCRAAIESLSENYSDGVVAPLFWLVVAGLPGAIAYKAINTADSMVGHLNERYRAFGWASARLDDLVNIPASRLAGILIVGAAMVVPGANGRAAFSMMWRDAAKHRSPNAGWPEAAMAGALGLRLAGPRLYQGELLDDAFMGDGSAAATAGDISRALQVYRAACVIQLVLVCGLAASLLVVW